VRPAPAVAGAFTQWQVAVLPILVAVAALVLYLAGLRSVRARGGTWSTARALTFVVPGVGSYVVVTLGFLGVYSPYLRWAFAGQAALLLLIVPVLLALGRPVALARKALSDDGVRRLDRFVESRLMRMIVHPVGGPAVLLAVLMLFLSPLPNLTRTHAVALAIVQVLLPVLGFLVVSPVAAGEEPVASTTMAIGFFIAFFELIADALPGILLRLHEGVIGGSAALAVRPPWLPSPLRDQQLAGDVLWFLGEAIDLPFLAWLVVRWIRADAREAATIDARLDAEQAARTASAHPGATTGTAPAPGGRPAAPEPELMRPWWEVEAEQRAAARARTTGEATGTDAGAT
jgi:cytochrome c oxidase assembly factor CtaG